MREVFKAIGLAAATDAAVLIVGESGTGKELVAAAPAPPLDRAAGPFIRVNCGALPEGLIESELFGHERGAFTGADRQKPGRFERAAGGTIFLDEVGELPLGGPGQDPPRPAAARIRARRREPRRSAPTPVSSRPRTATCPRRSPRAGSARTCTIASTSPGSSSRRSATAPRTSRRWPSTSCGVSSGGTAGASFALPRGPRGHPGPALAGQRPPTGERPGARGDRRAGPGHPARAPRRRRVRHDAGLPRGGRRRGAPAAPRPAGRGRAARDPASLAGLRRQPHQDRRTPRHQPPPALRQDPRVRPWHPAHRQEHGLPGCSEPMTGVASGFLRLFPIARGIG